MALSNLYDKPEFSKIFRGRKRRKQQPLKVGLLQGRESLQARIAREHPRRKPKPKKAEKPGFLGF